VLLLSRRKLVASLAAALVAAAVSQVWDSDADVGSEPVRSFVMPDVRSLEDISLQMPQECPRCTRIYSLATVAVRPFNDSAATL
jgi:hypothetical protein